MGFRNQLRADGKYKDGFVGILEDSNEQEELEAHRLRDPVGGEILHVHVEGEAGYRDDLTGQLLPPGSLPSPPISATPGLKACHLVAIQSIDSNP